MRYAALGYDLDQFPPDMAAAFKYGLGAVARRFLKRSNLSDMEDYAQIAWLAVLKVSRKGFTGDSLRRIAANEAIAEWIRIYGNRSKWVGSVSGEDFDAMPVEIRVAEDRETESREIDEKWLSMLTPTMRELVHAVIVDGMSHKGAAEKLGLTEKTVRTTICRAKQRIRNSA